MSTLNVHPQLARAILTSTKLNCVDEMAVIAAIISCSEVSVMKIEKEDMLPSEKYKKFLDKSGDHMTILNIFYEWMKASNKKEWAKKTSS